MKLKVFIADTFIAHAEVYALDPSMSVAMASLNPVQNYDARLHANVIDGEYVGEKGRFLRIETDGGSAIETSTISIHDCPTINERELHFVCIDNATFDALFSDHPLFME